MKTKLCILFGGKSSEYEVSLRSAASVLSHINEGKYDIFTVGITRDGKWLRTYCDYDSIEDGSWINDSRNCSCVISPDASHHGLLFADGTVERIDVIFPVMHGENCEDGAIQGLLTLSGIPFVGCGIAASANTMDKAITKLFADRVGIKQAKSITVYSSQFQNNENSVIKNAVQNLGFPIFVKPSRTGSSVGVSKANTADELSRAIKESMRFDCKVILEECIFGQEIECAVFGDAHNEVITSVVGEIAPTQEFYTYSAKYSDESSALYIPARISDDAAKTVRDNAEKIYRALECFGLSRVDFFLSRDGDIVFNEINSIPGFTSISMYPKLFEAAGITYSTLIDRLISLAEKR